MPDKDSSHISGRVFITSKTLKRSLLFFALSAAAAAVLSITLAGLFTADVVVRAEQASYDNLKILWESYKDFYITGGRVVRPKNDFDTVSEGQAYAMIRAVWLDDRAAFDAVYRWSEENLSRFRSHGDHLLSWRYGANRLGGEQILDANPALDADLDYALALFMAARRWPDRRIMTGLMSYRDKAVAVAEDIMRRCVMPHANGELVLLPWPAGEGAEAERSVLVNPSYFSPGHYRIFEMETGNRRWGKLANDTYQQIDRLLTSPRGEQVTVPDWIVMRPDGGFAIDPARGWVSGWDAFRLWWRVRLDYDYTGNPQARSLLEKRLVAFLDKSMELSGGEPAAESERDGTPIVRASNPGMTAVYAWSLRDLVPSMSRTQERQTIRRMRREGDRVYFQDKDDYYTNSWAWFGMAEGKAAEPFCGLLDTRDLTRTGGSE